MSKTLVSPSILNADLSRVADECISLVNAGADWLHLDVMDGVFVPNISFGMPLVKAIDGCTDAFLDVHLMISRPEKYVKQFAESGADLITFHVEATEQPKQTIELIKSCGKKVGIAVKPATPVEALLPFAEDIDLLLVMSVEPGFGGQAFMPEAIEKIKRAKALFPNALVQVDGGINAQTAPSVIAAGVDVIVSGSAIVSATDRAAAISALRNA